MILACHASNAGSIPAGIVALLCANCSLITVIMTNAFDTILNTYDLETCKEIVDHGWQSGVCSQHIYYGDTIKFFETYEDEITEYIESNFGTEFLVEEFKKADADLGSYMNNLAWAFIELVAMQVVDEYEEQERSDDETIGNYMKEEISNNGYTASDLSGYNPEGSMSMSRYANI